MKKGLKKIVITVIIACSFIVIQGYSQNVAMHTQGILQQEFLNPAYNSFRDYISLSAYNRVMWGNKFEYAPESYVGNLFLPVNKTRFGVNLGVVVEDIGLRTTTELKASLCHNIHFTKKSYLAFGYSVGFLQNSFDRDKIISYPDEDLSYLLEKTDLNKTYPVVSVGMLFLAQKWYAGISSMSVCIEDNMDNSEYFPGFDFSCGAIFPLSSWVRVRPGLIIKYYNEEGIKSSNGVVNDKYNIPAIYDLSANFLFGNRFWFGTSHRFNQAQTFSFDFMVGHNLKMGYTFEYGIGEGLNQYNTHGIRLSYIIGHKNNKESKEGLDIWPGAADTQENTATLIY